jgi:hypothetical protein
MPTIVCDLFLKNASAILPTGATANGYARDAIIPKVRKVVKFSNSALPISPINEIMLESIREVFIVNLADK